jgi:hypothetical protein
MTSEIKDLFSKQTLQLSDIEFKEQKKDILKGRTTNNINQDYPDPKELELELKLEEVKLKKLEYKSKHLEINSDNTSKNLDIFLRHLYGCWVLVIVTSFLLFVKEILYLKFNYEKTLSDTVIIALLTTTTINILTLAFMVISNLFPKKLKKKLKKKTNKN